MTIAFDLNSEDTKLVENWAIGRGLSVPELARQVLLEKIEDERDLQAYREAYAEYEAEPVTYSHAEMRKILELD